MSSKTDIDKEARFRIDAITKNAEAKVKEAAAPARSQEWFQRNLVVPTAPIFIASTEDIGTDRVRANHLDAAIHYYEEQERLAAKNAPL